MAYRLVLVEWVDSRQHGLGWQNIAHFKPLDVCNCVSVGWLIYDGDDVKALAPNMADVDDDEEQASAVIHIPTVAIKRMVKIEEI